MQSHFIIATALRARQIQMKTKARLKKPKASCCGQHSRQVAELGLEPRRQEHEGSEPPGFRDDSHWGLTRPAQAMYSYTLSFLTYSLHMLTHICSAFMYSLSFNFLDSVYKVNFSILILLKRKQVFPTLLTLEMRGRNAAVSLPRSSRAKQAHSPALAFPHISLPVLTFPPWWQIQLTSP